MRQTKPVYYPVRNWRKDQRLVIIGKHKSRVLESYNWKGYEYVARAAHGAAARGVQRIERGTASLVDLTKQTDDEDSEISLSDDGTYIVYTTPELSRTQAPSG